MNKRLLLIGAGHAHLTLIRNIPSLQKRGYEVIVIGPQPYHYYSGMGPGMLGGDYSPEQVRFPVKKMVQSRGAAFLTDVVTAINAENKTVRTASGLSLEYDVISFTTGSSIPGFANASSTDVYPVKPVENLFRARQRIQELARQKVVRIGVIGGGPAALEVAGNAWVAAAQVGGYADVRIYGGKRFLRRVPASVADKARKILQHRGISVFEGEYVTDIVGRTVIARQCQSREEDILFTAVGVRPSSLFEQAGIPAGPEGGLAVNAFLQSEKYPEIFGGGDCIYFTPSPLAKVGVYAVRQNRVLLANIIAALEDEPLHPFNPGGAYLLVYNMGNQEGIFHRNGLVFGGQLAFEIKNYIDRKFMRKFLD